uniref:SWIM-type domain-containing protein n=1 Tax=Ascaris lumbricoides TaxID=6252 RepID=A0A0M3IB48_ASCLU
MIPDAPFRHYNYTVEFEDEIALDLFIQEKGFRRVNERERNGVIKINYVCKEFWQKDIRCTHKLSVIRKGGILSAKTTDGGMPHDHTRRPLPLLNFDEKNRSQSTSSDPEKIEGQLHEIIRHSAPDLLAKLKDAYERKKREQEKIALKLFTKMSSEKQKSILSTYGCFDD